MLEDHDQLSGHTLVAALAIINQATRGAAISALNFMRVFQELRWAHCSEAVKLPPSRCDKRQKYGTNVTELAPTPKRDTPTLNRGWVDPPASSTAVSPLPAAAAPVAILRLQSRRGLFLRWR